MLRITMTHRLKHRITSKILFERLGFGSFDSYFNRRLLRWAGHVARMPKDRMPCKLLTGWVDHDRPAGCPQTSWGRKLNKALKTYEFPTVFGQKSEVSAERRACQQRIGVRPPCPRQATTMIRDTWRELLDDPK